MRAALKRKRAMPGWTSHIEVPAQETSGQDMSWRDVKSFHQVRLSNHTYICIFCVRYKTVKYSLILISSAGVKHDYFHFLITK